MDEMICKLFQTITPLHVDVCFLPCCRILRKLRDLVFLKQPEETVDVRFRHVRRKILRQRLIRIPAKQGFIGPAVIHSCIHLFQYGFGVFIFGSDGLVKTDQ